MQSSNKNKKISTSKTIVPQSNNKMSVLNPSLSKWKNNFNKYTSVSPNLKKYKHKDNSFFSKLKLPNEITKIYKNKDKHLNFKWLNSNQKIKK